MAGANLDLEEKSSMHVHMTALMAEQDAATHMGSSEYHSLRDPFSMYPPLRHAAVQDRRSLLLQRGLAGPFRERLRISATSLRRRG